MRTISHFIRRSTAAPPGGRTGQLEAALADGRAVLVRHRHDAVVDLGHLGGGDHLLVRRLDVAVAHVVVDVIVEENRVLATEDARRHRGRNARAVEDI